MTLLCLVLCACGVAAAHALQATTVPERAALLSLVQQVASPTALFQTSKDDCRRVSEVRDALERSEKAPSAPSMTQSSASALSLELSVCSSSAGIDAKLP